MPLVRGGAGRGRRRAEGRDKTFGKVSLMRCTMLLNRSGLVGLPLLTPFIHSAYLPTRAPDAPPCSPRCFNSFISLCLPRAGGIYAFLSLATAAPKCLPMRFERLQTHLFLVVRPVLAPDIHLFVLPSTFQLPPPQAFQDRSGIFVAVSARPYSS